MQNLALRLRRDTADLHAAVEATTGLPGSVRSRGDYVSLLSRLYSFHVAAEVVLMDPRWAAEWAGVPLDPARYRRAYLLAADLGALQVPVPRVVAPFPPIEDFPTLLGCLYVLEGSALGGRVIGPAIRSVIGDVPTGFFDGVGRGQPSPWQSLTEALNRFDDGDGDDGAGGAAAVRGARWAFLAFEAQLTPGQDRP